MDRFDTAYYLDGQQLLLLLSLIDQRPVAGLSTIAESENWQLIFLSLFQEGWLHYECGQLVMDEGLSELLLTMKETVCVYAIYGGKPVPVSQVLYAGETPVMLEFPVDEKFRLSQVTMLEFRQLVEERLMSSCPLPEELLVSLTDDPILMEYLDRWKRQAMTLQDSPDLWTRLDQVSGVLEYLTLETQTRWIWIEDTAAAFVLKQDRNGTDAELDTASQRKRLLRELGWEA